MFKKFILLFSISFCWQANLFSIYAKGDIESIDNFDEELTKCAKCGSKISLNEEGDYLYWFTCNEPKCKQRHYMKKPSFPATIEYRELKPNRNNEKSIDNNDRSKINSIAVYSKLKYYLVSVAVVCLVIWKYSNQIKKILFRK